LVAALSVAYYHWFAATGTPRGWGRPGTSIFPTMTKLAPYGWLGVDVFFVISGFVICMSTWGKTLHQFFRSRVQRLYPAYWFGVGLTSIAVWSSPLIDDGPEPWTIAVNLTMLQNPLGVHPVDAVYWTLWAELRFYLLFALVVVAFGATYRRVAAFCMIWTVVGALMWGDPEHWFVQLAMPTQQPYFVLGIGIYLLHRFGHHFLTWGIVLVNAGLCVHTLSVAKPVWSARTHTELHDSVVYGLFFLGVAFILAVALGRLTSLKWRWLTVAGAMTYPFYLLHDRIGRILIASLYQDAGLSAYLTVVVVLVTVLLLAYSVQRWVERPVSKWVGRQLDELPTELPAAKPLGGSRRRGPWSLTPRATGDGAPVSDLRGRHTDLP
jgi:peptidoglycan/LPS O-acetylase OafA/YrhL